MLGRAAVDKGMLRLDTKASRSGCHVCWRTKSLPTLWMFCSEQKLGGQPQYILGQIITCREWTDAGVNATLAGWDSLSANAHTALFSQALMGKVMHVFVSFVSHTVCRQQETSEADAGPMSCLYFQQAICTDTSRPPSHLVYCVSPC